jgi:hypothetical protein
MLKIESSLALRNAILELEQTREAEGKALRRQFDFAYESAKPVNLIKKAFTDLSFLNKIESNTVNVSALHAGGYVSKKLIVGTSASPFRKLLHSVLMLAVTKAVEQKPEVLKSGIVTVFEIVKSVILPGSPKVAKRPLPNEMKFEFLIKGFRKPGVTKP